MELPEALSPLFTLLIQRNFSQQDLTVSWTRTAPRISKTQQSQADVFWQAFRADNPHKLLYDGPLCRLISFRESDSGVALALGPITYKIHFHNINCGGAFAHDLEAFGLGVSTVVITADNQLLYLRRSDAVAASAGQLDVFGGHIDPRAHVTAQADGPGVPSPFGSIQFEVREELNLGTDQIDSLWSLGLIRNLLSGQPELLFRCRTSLTTTQVLAQAEKALDKHEYGQILAIENERENLIRLCLDQASAFSPSGLANLWLHANDA